MNVLGYCEECDNWVEAVRVPDGPDFCTECRSVDCIDFDRKEEEDEKDTPSVILNRYIVSHDIEGLIDTCRTYDEAKSLVDNWLRDEDDYLPREVVIFDRMAKNGKPESWRFDFELVESVNCIKSTIKKE